MLRLIILFFAVLLLLPHGVRASAPEGLIKSLDSSSVYYHAQDGKRYVFPNQKVYESWFYGFDDVKVISDVQMGRIPIGGNVTYRPGVRLIKIQSDPKVYAVDRGGVLRWVTSETIARTLFGEDWNQKIDDLEIGFFSSYTVGNPITGIFEYSSRASAGTSSTIEDDKSIPYSIGINRSITQPIAEGIRQTPLSIDPDHFLTIISVSDAAKSSYFEREAGWESMIATKQSEDTEIFEVVFWNNGKVGNPNKISVYRFDDSFDRTGFYGTDAEYVSYRERYRVFEVGVPDNCIGVSGNQYHACSKAYLDALKSIFNVIITSSPAEEYALKYMGHGSNAGLFEYRLSDADSEALLKFGNELMGQKFAFLDWGYNCSMGNITVLSSQYAYTDFIRSSDMLRQGFAADWPRDYKRLAPEGNLHRFFSPGKSIAQSLLDMNDADRIFWETDTVRENMISNNVKQSVSIYDMSKYPEFAYATQIEAGSYTGDVFSLIKGNSRYRSMFDDLLIGYVHNKDFFQWDKDQNGLWKN